MRVKVLLLMIVLIVAIIQFIQPAGSIYTGYRTSITITNPSSQNLTDYQVKIVLNSTNWDGWSYVSSDGSDIYFLDSANNPLYYWIESFDYENKQATIWVKVNITASSSTTIYMYYGGTNPYSSYNDPNKVFLFYDDFETFDTNKWSKYGSGTASVSNSVLTVTASDGGGWTYVMSVNPIYIDVGAVIEILGISTGIDYGGQGTLYAGLTVSPPSSGASKTSSAFGSTKRVGMGEGDAYDWGIQIETGDGSGYTYSTYLTYDHGFSGLNIRIYWKPSQIYAEYWGYVSGTKTLTSYIAPMNTNYYILIGSCDTWSGSYSPPSLSIDKIIIREYIDPEPSISIGSSVVVKPSVSIVSVVPGSVEAVVGSSVDIIVSINYTYDFNDSISVVVELVDYSATVRDSINIGLQPNTITNTSLKTILGKTDIGIHTWRIIVRDNTTIYDEYNLTITVHELTTTTPSLTTTTTTTTTTRENVDAPVYNPYNNININTILGALGSGIIFILSLLGKAKR